MANQNLKIEPYEGEKAFIYACYSHADKEVIGDLEYLQKKRFRIWFDQGIGENNNWKESIKDHIVKCNLFMIFVSAQSIHSDYVLAELQSARSNNKPMLPVFLEDIRKSDDLDYISLKMIQGINRWEYSQQMEKYYIHLVNSLENFDIRFHNISPKDDRPKGDKSWQIKL